MESRKPRYHLDRQQKRERQNRGTQKRYSVKLDPQRVGQKCKAYTVPKIKWATQVDAQMAICNTNNKLGSTTHRTGNAKQEIRSFQCDHCGFWHTTSQEFRPKNHREDHDDH